MVKNAILGNREYRKNKILIWGKRETKGFIAGEQGEVTHSGEGILSSRYLFE